MEPLAVGIVLVALAALFLASNAGASLNIFTDKKATRVNQLAQAIARAEGFYVSSSLPARTHNPGDLKLGDIGNGEEHGKTKFGSDAEGWSALRKQIELILSNRSNYYSASDSFAQLAETWTGSDNSDSWLNTVLQFTGALRDQSIESWVNS